MIWWILIVASVAWVGFAYAVYPLILVLLARFSPRPFRSGDDSPPLSVIITVHNGGERLRHKLEETLALDYAGSVEVIVASDGSTDETEAIAQSLSDRGVRLVRNAERLGKEAAQAAAIPHTRGEILVFTDIGAELEKEALCNIARPFSDPTVACVSSEDWVESEEGEQGYVQIEMALRRLETAAATLVGLSGSFFAVRRSLCSPWPAELASDFRCALEAVRRGLRAVAEPTARARFGSTPKTSSEWTRRVRTPTVATSCG